MKKDTILSVLVMTFMLLVCTGCAFKSDRGFDWPAWRGPAGDGISRESGWNPAALAGGPKILWQVNVGLGYSSVAIRDNLLVTMGTMKGFTIVYGLKADTGKRVWKYSYENYDETQATPAIDEGSVYALDKEGLLCCLNSKNGKLRWKKDLVADFRAVKPYYGFAGLPVIRGDLVLLAANTAADVGKETLRCRNAEVRVAHSGRWQADRFLDALC